MNPLISVIIPTYNSGDQLYKAVSSVTSQLFSNYELWIIDGGSTDGTIDYLKATNQPIHWISEPDRGIYDAMNKGIDRAKGQWIYFLGADDELLPSVLNKMKPELDTRYDAVFGSVIFDNGARIDSKFSIRTTLQNTVHHQSVFYNRNLFASFRYDIHYRAISDYELNLKLWLDHLPYKKVSVTIARCGSEGVSSSFDISLKETNQVRNKYVPSKLMQFLLSFLLQVYYTQKKIRGVSMVGKPVR